MLMIQNNEEKEMTFENVVIIDDRYGCADGGFRPVIYNSSTVSEAIRDFRRCHGMKVGAVCLAYTGAAWHFMGYIQDLVV